jgi:hypothetical protein
LRHVPKFVALIVIVAATLTSPAGLAHAATPAVAPDSGVTPAWGTYQTVAPARVLDTRLGTGARKGPILAGGTISLSVLGAAGVPATGVSAVVLNVTVTGATKPSYLTVFPAGTTRPTASSINFVAGADRANLVTAQVGTGAGAGKVSVYNPTGSVQVIADVMGYYVADGGTAGGFYMNVTPERLLDTRTEPGFGGPLGPNWYVDVPVSYAFDSDPANVTDANPHIRALAVNITAVSPTKPGYLAAWDGGSVVPTTSTVNFAAGSITPNMAIVPVGPCADCGTATGHPSIRILNGSAGTVHMVIDIVGIYDDGQIVDTLGVPIEGLRFKPLTPTRIVDTRTGLGATTFTGASAKTITSPASVAGNDTWALVTNSTAILPTLPTYLTMWSHDSVMPGVSNLNAAKGQIVANATLTDVGLGNKFDIFNGQGTTNVVVDVMGSMEWVPTVASPAALSATAGPRTWTSKATLQPAPRTSR